MKTRLSPRAGWAFHLVMNNDASAILIAEVANGGWMPPWLKTRMPTQRLAFVGRCGFLKNYLRRDATALGLILLSI